MKSYKTKLKLQLEMYPSNPESWKKNKRNKANSLKSGGSSLSTFSCSPELQELCRGMSTIDTGELVFISGVSLNLMPINKFQFTDLDTEKNQEDKQLNLCWNIFLIPFPGSVSVQYVSSSLSSLNSSCFYCELFSVPS